MIEPARDLLRRAIADRVFPAAVAEVGDSGRVIWREAFGTLTYAPESPATTHETIFDLASLAKPIVTGTLAVGLTGTRALSLEDPVATFFADWRGGDRELVTIRELLEHASGLPARLLDQAPTTRREFEHDICTLPLEYEPRSRSVYSDLGFILLGFAVEDSARAPLDAQFRSLWGMIESIDERSELLRFEVPRERAETVAPTTPLADDVRRARVLAGGSVHDNYAAALGGVAGHSGLFGNAAAVGRFARAMLKGARGDAHMPGPFSPSLVRLATTKSTVPGSSRALAWDTMLPTSSCGAMLTPAAFGHVGFTGTSLWIDPVLDRYFVLLTNRAYGAGTLDEMRTVRRSFHDILANVDS
jgi:CubicO group peptidase (beta-lactamase class C family)